MLDQINTSTKVQKKTSNESHDDIDENIDNLNKDRIRNDKNTINKQFNVQNHTNLNTYD